MKMKTPHIVPLSVQAVNLLRTLHLITGHSVMLFPGERDHEKSMSNNTILKALERMGYKGRMTGHGFVAWPPRCCMRWGLTMPTSSCNWPTKSGTK
jgi:integrase